MTTIDGLAIEISSGGGGGAGGNFSGMFEEAELSPWAKWLQDHLSAIKVLVGSIATGIAAWKLATGFMNAIQKVKDKDEQKPKRLKKER